MSKSVSDNHGSMPHYLPDIQDRRREVEESEAFMCLPQIPRLWILVTIYRNSVGWNKWELCMELIFSMFCVFRKYLIYIYSRADLVSESPTSSLAISRKILRKIFPD